MSSSLFTPLCIGNLTLENRIAIPPMCQYSAVGGLPADWHSMHYGTLACSGAGMLIVEGTGVEHKGRISPNCLGLWSEEHTRAHARMLQSIHHHSNMPVGIQLMHSGRKGSARAPWLGPGMASADEGGWIPLAPSPLPFNEGDIEPIALDENGIQAIVKSFVAAARRADEAGYDFVEIHAAHGYLLHQFLSPITNKRTDAYGGSLSNRMRLTLQTFAAIRAAFPAEKPVGVRISATDWIEGGWNVNDSIELIKELQKLGCAYAHVSSGGLDLDQGVPVKPGYQVQLAQTIKQATCMPTIAVGLITSPEQAENIITSGQADMVAIGRGMLFNPRWPWHAAFSLGATVTAPPQYWHSAPQTSRNLFKKDI